MTETAFERAERIVSWIMSSNCDAACAGKELLGALADANLQEADENDDDANADHEAALQADTLLFVLATRVSGGRRWRHDESE